MPNLPSTETKEKRYREAYEKITSMLEGESDEVARMASVSSILAGTFGHFYWTGFYRMVDGGLVVGPYQGTPGCLRIALDRGVCGASASQKQTIIVPDTHAFPGHIACDARSLSEIVVPVFDPERKLIAVLDVDCDQLEAFDDQDQQGLERIVRAVFAEAE
ncbi:GAF domain-containing protein [Verrucomicrobiaceae bacterium R5-34]|uniref:GAF domain-containing protein n=1 Tax=Oceaniferula flava TaxID=2800421 RepID=A0AAE2V7J5_9BACT|nr:GAF domain-containing protein [Oceaniferula flavus]MBK1829716.1 GAF domain-containing protein [Verrucomicrobiaceae bacterium R5-34]MBK1853902.1 GAF domain-containing protein [Oceaniferula flavus]MBM1135208.1 GAF domain-containing protein [Oceaniferula flavus]